MKLAGFLKVLQAPGHAKNLLQSARGVCDEKRPAQAELGRGTPPDFLLTSPPFIPRWEPFHAYGIAL
jgi:hypothetical protein